VRNNAQAGGFFQHSLKQNKDSWDDSQYEQDDVVG